MTHQRTGAVAAGSHDGSQHHQRRDHGRTLAQWYATLVGATLLLIGLLGFISDATFDTGTSGLQGDGFLGFEVNGWHNLVHLVSGLFLLSMAKKRRTAKAAVTAFGVIYGLVALIGLIDGNDVLGIIPVNGADNVLHIALSALALYCGLTSRGDDPMRRDHDLDAPRHESGRFDRSTTGSPIESTTPQSHQEVTRR